MVNVLADARFGFVLMSAFFPKGSGADVEPRLVDIRFGAMATGKDIAMMKGARQPPV